MPKAPPRHRPGTSGARVHKAPERDRQAARAMPTNLAPWRRLRALKLSLNPLCECCQRHGCPRCAPSGVRVASQVDHVSGDANDNRMENLQAICPSCHSYKTSAHDGGWGNRQRNA